jgi:hypothetical protein
VAEYVEHAADGLIGRKMRTRTAVAVILLSGLASIGVPSAAADELPPTPAVTSSVTAAADEPAPVPTPEPSEEPTTEVTTSDPESSAAPTVNPAEPGDEETAVNADEATGEPTEAADPTQPAEEPDDAQPAGAGAAAGVPAVTAGALDCLNGTVPLALDNSTVTTATTFTVNIYDFAVAGVLLNEPHVVPAMGNLDVVVPIPENSSRFQVAVSADGGVSFLLLVQLTCEPTAVIGAMDCSSETFSITLNNSTESSATSFTVTVTDATGGTYFRDAYVVPATATRVVDAPIPDNVDFGWRVVADGTWLLFTSSRAQCLPTFSVGALDCVAGTLPLTLNNSTEPADTSFTIGTRTLGSQPYHATYIVPPGATLQVAVPIPDDFSVTVSVLADGNTLQFGEEGTGTYSCVDRAAHQGAATISDVDCSTQTVAVTLDNSSSTVVVDFLVVTGDVESLEEDQHPSTSEHVPVAAGGTHVVQITAPYWDVFEAWIVEVHDLNLADPENIFDGPQLASRHWSVVGPSSYGRIDTGCPAPSASVQAPSASVQARKLANTGHSTTPALVGVALLTSGALLTLAAKPRRRDET